MKWSLVVGILTVCFSLSPLRVNSIGEYARTVSYDGDIVLRCPDKNKPTVAVLEQYSDIFHAGKESIDLRINRARFQRVQQYFTECTVLIQDLEAHMQEAEAQMFPVKAAAQEEWMKTVIQDLVSTDNLKDCEAKIEEWENQFQGSRTWFENYHNYDDIIDWYKKLAEKENMVSYEVIGQSYEGRDMPAIRVTASKDPNRKKIYLQCQIHAREWITGSVCMYLVNYLVQAYGNDQQINRFLNHLEFLVVPFVNPDGYVYTWTNDRLWRKNRHKYTQAPGTGVDINRNFNLGFLRKDWSQSNAEDYPGPYPLSEPETRNVVNFFKSNGPILGAIDFHSYGELILRPFGYTNMTSPDEKWLKELSTNMVNEIKRIHNQVYTAERSQDLYPCYGIGADWFYGDDAASQNGGYRAASLCVELRDKTGQYGFVLPADQIIPTVEEVLPAFLEFVKGVSNNPIPFRPSLLGKGQLLRMEQHG